MLVCKVGQGEKKEEDGDSQVSIFVKWLRSQSGCCYEVLVDPGLEREREQTRGCIQISKRKVGPDKERRTSHVAKEGHAVKGETKLARPNH